MSVTGFVWFVMGVLFMIAEFVVPGFVIFFFGVGALITAGLTQIGIIESFPLQITVFIVTSVLSLVVFRKKWSKYFPGNAAETGNSMIEDITGEKAIVKSMITPRGMGGKVEYHGTLWEAEADEIIKEGTVVEIIKRKNLILTVKPVE